MKKFSYFRDGQEATASVKNVIECGSVKFLDLGDEGTIIVSSENVFLGECKDLHYTGGLKVISAVDASGRNRKIKAIATHELDDFTVIEPESGGIVIIDRDKKIVWETKEFEFVSARSYYVGVKTVAENPRHGVWSCWKARFKVNPIYKNAVIKRRSFELTGVDDSVMYLNRNLKRLQKIGKTVECAEAEIFEYRGDGYSHAIFKDEETELLGVYDYINDAVLYKPRFETVVNEGHYFKGIYPEDEKRRENVAFFDADGDLFPAISN